MQAWASAGLVWTRAIMVKTFSRPLLHSRDLVNRTFLGYAMDQLDLGPAFRFEEERDPHLQ